MLDIMIPPHRERLPENCLLRMQVVNTNIVSSRHRGIDHYLLIWKAVTAVELHCETLAIAIT
jgi:hypothetical protein